MTYHDPRDPNSDLGRNPPRYRDLDDGSGFSSGAIAAALVAAAIVGGALIYAMSDRSPTTASGPAMGPPATVGQGTAPAPGNSPAPTPRSNVNPGAQQNTPNPMPPANEPDPAR